MENLRLGVSAVRHDMKREETVEEVEKNTKWYAVLLSGM